MLSWLLIKELKLHIKIILFLISIACVQLDRAFAEIVTTKCVSPSGASVYELKFDLTNNKGEIRYKYMKQDVFYKVALEKTGGKIKGIAIFDRSNSGEKRGNPFNFEYSLVENTFTDLNLKSKCE
jgi:hypothetical protein